MLRVTPGLREDRDLQKSADLRSPPVRLPVVPITALHTLRHRVLASVYTDLEPLAHRRDLASCAVWLLSRFIFADYCV